ncbi:MAG: serine/threonine protein kinase [Betaproteobacteria bacterium]|nr:serine/threonine protein kinase [Betaproteobacteria bacterium]
MSQPDKIGKYQIVKELGKGAMGMVYEGFDPGIERRVAIKTILPEYLQDAESEEAVARFKREAQASGRLQHPGIVQVYEYSEDGGMAYIVMEYAEGSELKDHLKKGKRFEMIHIFEIMKQLLVALDYSHKQGVIHRDIKPANIMLTNGLKVKLMDFGIARIGTSSMTQVGTVVGTPSHMAPEQLMGLTADGRTDLWATAIVLYELLTGKNPFLAETPAAVMHNVLSAEPPPPSFYRPDIPASIDTFFKHALAKKPADRFANAREFLTNLLQAFQGKEFTATVAMKAMDAEKTQPINLGTAQADATQRVAAPGEETRIMAKALDIAPERLKEIEGSLTRYLGPLAKVVVRESQAVSSNLDQFFAALADNIAEGAEKEAFLKRVKVWQGAELSSPHLDATGASAPRPAEASTPRAVFSPEVLSTAEKRLASYVGPLAKLLIKQTAGSTGTIKELYAKLAENIDDPAERKAFLATVDRA